VQPPQPGDQRTSDDELLQLRHAATVEGLLTTSTLGTLHAAVEDDQLRMRRARSVVERLFYG